MNRTSKLKDPTRYGLLSVTLVQIISGVMFWRAHQNQARVLPADVAFIVVCFAYAILALVACNAGHGSLRRVAIVLGLILCLGFAAYIDSQATGANILRNGLILQPLAPVILIVTIWREEGRHVPVRTGLVLKSISFGILVVICLAGMLFAVADLVVSSQASGAENFGRRMRVDVALLAISVATLIGSYILLVRRRAGASS